MVKGIVKECVTYLTVININDAESTAFIIGRVIIEWGFLHLHDKARCFCIG
jgi:hypothetical protein